MIGFRRAVALGLLAAGLSAAGCNTGTTPGFPTPDLQAPLDAPFALRAGELAYVQGPSSFLYLSVRSVGIDSRCPPGTTCDEPGSLEVILELETLENQGSAAFHVPPTGSAVATYQGFEIRILEAQPPGSESRILPTDYAFLVSVALR
jgi:hypothetical protein